MLSVHSVALAFSVKSVLFWLASGRIAPAMIGTPWNPLLFLVMISDGLSGLPPDPSFVEFALTGDDLIASQFDPQPEDLTGFVDIRLYRKCAVAPRGHKHGQAPARSTTPDSVFVERTVA